MLQYSRTDLITTLGMTLTSIDSVSDKKLHRSAAHTMFEIILAQWHLINLKTDGELVRMCQHKAKEGGAEFKKYVDKFEELLNPPPPPLRRSARLRARKAPK
tara:strand:+ start:129 stop:434 length:306 start_codon:yes stop_codon:yes gene_type:complete